MGLEVELRNDNSNLLWSSSSVELTKLTDSNGTVHFNLPQPTDISGYPDFYFEIKNPTCVVSGLNNLPSDWKTGDNQGFWFSTDKKTKGYYEEFKW